MILIVSNDEDDHARAVIESLRRRKGVAAQLLDLSRFPRELHLGLDYDEGAALEAKIAAAHSAAERWRQVSLDERIEQVRQGDTA